ncbi:MAG: hypothetical protein CL607_18915 [Anaerolineaceae bacterium]|nr:hypothetical protein [Anaerolineaceae bacterium]
MPKFRSILCIVVFLLFASIALAQDGSGLVPMVSENARPTEIDFTVNSTADSVDINPGDGICADSMGRCTLRASIIESNALRYIQNIYVPAGKYVLSIPGTDEDDGYTGDLDVRDEIFMFGDGPGLTIIDANGLDRVFHFKNSLSYEAGMPGSVIQWESHLHWMTIKGGYAPYGGGIYHKLGGLVISHVEITDNTTYSTHPCTLTSGAAVYSADVMQIEYASIVNNIAPSIGSDTSLGAITGSTALIHYSTIANNQVDWAIIIPEDSCDVLHHDNFLYFDANTISNNAGGAVLVQSHQVILQASTITNNARGVKVDTREDSSNLAGLESRFVTIADNTEYGIRIESADSIGSNGSIIANNGTDCILLGDQTISGEGNVFSDNSCGTPAFTRNVSGVDPLLAPLADNGNGVPTRMLLPGSPAVDYAGGQCLDQRFFTRNFALVCDSGAVQQDAPTAAFAPYVDPAFTLKGNNVSAVNDSVYINFSEQMYNPAGDGDPDDVTNLANYVLLSPGEDGVFDASTCTSDFGDDTVIALDRLIYHLIFPFIEAYHVLPGMHTNHMVQLVIDTSAYPNGLSAGEYRLILCGNLRDMESIPLMGRYTALAGDQVFDFDVDENPLATLNLEAYFSETPTVEYVEVTEDLEIHEQIQFLLIRTTDQVGLNPMSGEDLANYQLVVDGPNGILETTNCASVTGDDILVDISSLDSGAFLDHNGLPTFVNAGPSDAIRITTEQPLTLDRYRFIACDGITDISLRPIDGDADGIAGGHFIRDFSVIIALPVPLAPTLNDYSDVLVALNLPTVSDVPAGTVMQIERTTSGSASIVGSVDVGTASFVDSNLVCETAYRYRVRLYDANENQFSEWSNYLDVITANCVTSLQHTFGLYKEGQWLFYAVDGYQREDVRFQFGPAEPGWTALVGDWNGDGMPGIGLYKAGIFMLRELDGAGVTDISFDFGPPTGATPLVGDWDGNGSDTVGVFVDGTFFLRNSNDTGLADLTFSLGSASSMPLAGDWNGDGTDSAGYFENNTFHLAPSGASPTVNASFSFGPVGWLPIVGDWNGDLTHTIGLYNNGLWRLRNSNTAGPVDYGFSYGDLAGGWQPLAFDGDTSGINRLFNATVPTPRVPIIPGPSVSTPTEAALDGYRPAYDEVPIEPTPLASVVLTLEITLTPEQAANPLSTATAVPSFTLEPTQTQAMQIISSLTPSPANE